MWRLPKVILDGKPMEPLNIAYNIDCMEYMRDLPDNAFDLAVVDPPYGDGNSQSVHAERERERGRTATTDSAAGGTDTKKYNRFGQRFDRYKSPAGGGYHGKDKYHMGQPGLGEHGQPNTAKKL